MAKSWQHNPLGKSEGAPAAQGRLAGFAWEGDGSQHLVYCGADKQIHELWQRRGGEWEHSGALSKKAGGPAATSAPAYYAWVQDGSQHILYRGEDQHIHELWYQAGAWKYGGALSKSAKAPVAAGAADGYAWEKDSSQHVVYRGADGHVHELWQRKGGAWQHGGALTKLAGAPVAASDPIGYVWEEDDSQHVVYRATDNLIHELWQKRGQSWRHGGAISQMTKAPAAAGVPYGYVWGRDRTQHIIYRGADGHIHELWQRQGEAWQYGKALTALTRAPQAADDPLGYTWEKDATQHVVYLGVDKHVHELWQRQGQAWQHNDHLDRDAGGPQAASGPAGYAWEGDGSQHIVYLGSDQKVHELWQRV